jgi:hypothetical protein
MCAALSTITRPASGDAFAHQPGVANGRELVVATDDDECRHCDALEHADVVWAPAVMHARLCLVDRGVGRAPIWRRRPHITTALERQIIRLEES